LGRLKLKPSDTVPFAFLTVRVTCCPGAIVFRVFFATNEIVGPLLSFAVF
jgi:hypothetical protein